MSNPSICILPRLEGLGGPISFQSRLAEGLLARGYGVHHDPGDPNCIAILVIGGTNRLWELWRARRRGVRIVQRLNGMNWLHRKQPTPLLAYLRAERSNLLLAGIRRLMADRIVYQSRFASDWWRTRYRSVRAPGQIIYNGVDLHQYTPQGSGCPPADRIRLLMVEGRLLSSNRQGLENAVALANRLSQMEEWPVELMVVGEVSEELKNRYSPAESTPARQSLIQWIGAVRREEIPQIDRSAHLLFSADLNAACPNSVIEALACGLPIVAFATGSLPELLEGEAGRVVPYGGNYWNLEPPDIPALAVAAHAILCDLPRYRQNARIRAEQVFDVNRMVERYLEVLVG